MILDNIEDGRTEDVIIDKLIKRFGLKREVAKNFFDKYAEGNMKKC